MSKSKFEVGDPVRLVKPFTNHGIREDWVGAEVGARGTVKSLGPAVNLSVRFHSADRDLWVDTDCLELDQVTDAELSEVYEILGVTKEARDGL